MWRCVFGLRLPFWLFCPLFSAAMCRLLLSFTASVTTSGQQRASRSPPPPPFSPLPPLACFPPPSPPPPFSSHPSLPLSIHLPSLLLLLLPPPSPLFLLCYFKWRGASWVLQCFCRACLVTYGDEGSQRKTTIPRVPLGPHQSIRLHHIREDGVGGRGEDLQREEFK